MSYLVARPGRRETECWYAEGTWTQETLPDVIRSRARVHPERIAIVEQQRRVTWRQLHNAMEHGAAALASAGVDRGDSVIIRLRDSAAFVAATAAVHAVEGVTIPVLAASAEQEISAIVSRIRPAGYAGPTEDWPCLQTLHRLDLDDQALWDQDAVALTGYEPDPDALMEVMFTSGTTGTPKGVMNSANTKFSGPRGFLSEIGTTSDDVWAVLAPMAHNAGWTYSCFSGLLSGATVVIVSRGKPERMLDVLAAEGVTVAFMVPTHAMDLTRHWESDPHRWDLSLRYVITGAAACPPGLIHKINDLWGATPISMYGMTECQGNLFTRPSDPLDLVAATVGRPCPGAEVALRSTEDGMLVDGEGEVGEIVTRGPLVFFGYFDDQDSTRASFTKDGWFRSGDLGTLVDGSIKIVGRIKEVINRGGANVAPDDVEACLREIPGAQEVSVVGIPDERLGEKICACIVGDATLDVVREHLAAAGASRGLWPDIVVNVDALPRTSLGKVQRAALTRTAVELINAGDRATAST